MASKTAKFGMGQFGHLLLTRERGKEIGAQIPEGVEELTLDFMGVDVASPSFVDEILKAAFMKGAQQVLFVNASDRTNQSIERLLERIRNPSASATAKSDSTPPSDDSQASDRGV